MGQIAERIRLEVVEFGCYIIVRDEPCGHPDKCQCHGICEEPTCSQLIQTDWDYPSVASTFGFVPCDECSKTDGTIDCQHKTASEMIAAAADWLCESIGETAEDPGYFA